MVNFPGFCQSGKVKFADITIFTIKAIKQTMRNPRWHRDELILTLNLYNNLNFNLYTKSNPEVIRLSKTLNSLPIFSEELRNSNFRNPSGVAMKLCNFMAIDPDNLNKGLSSYSNLDKEIFNDFRTKKKDLTRIAKLIIDSLADGEILNKLYKIEDEVDNLVKEAFEGETIFKLHKLKERDNKLIENKKKLILKETGKLECEVCNFDFLAKYGELGRGFIECHHNIPLSSYVSKQKTRLEELALVCSNCHRMLHRNSGNMSINTLKSKIIR